MAVLDNDGEVTHVKGSGSKPYELRNVGGTLSCSCPAWRNQSRPIDVRTCKHIISVRSPDLERVRVGDANMPTKFQNGSGTGPVATPAKRAGNGASPSSPPSPPSPRVKAASAPALLLANRWEPDVDPTGWWFSEKRDGVRAYFDGKDFISRQGNPFHAPDWFKEPFLGHVLDGELIIGRKMFSETISIVRSHDGGDSWRKIRYEVFDAPNHAGSFEARHQHCLSTLSGIRHCVVLTQTLCEGKDHLDRELSRIEGLGGEGVMLRKPGSFYEAGRSHTLLKVKSFLDCEAEVIGYVAGKKQFRGMVGSLRCRLPDGTAFNAGSGLTHALRQSPPPVGSTVTIRYQELTKDGVPRFPTFVAVREYE